jgi:uncharacterized alkaline shock family protein YloU
MAEDRLTIQKDQEHGEIVIAPEVLEVIIGIAASKVTGVYGMRGSFASTISQVLGRHSHGKGIVLTNDEEGNLIVDIYSYLNYGVSVPKVAMEMQEKVKQQVLYMTGLTLTEVNIHVVAVVPEKLAESNLESFLDEEDEAHNED